MSPDAVKLVMKEYVVPAMMKTPPDQSTQLFPCPSSLRLRVTVYGHWELSAPKKTGAKLAAWESVPTK